MHLELKKKEVRDNGDGILIVYWYTKDEHLQHISISNVAPFDNMNYTHYLQVKVMWKKGELENTNDIECVLNDNE